MPINPVVEKHLNEALDELRTQREDLDAAIAEVEATLRRLGGEVTVSSPAPPQMVEIGTAEEKSTAGVVTPLIAPPMKDAIVEYVGGVDHDVTTAQVVNALAPKWDWQPSSIRSLMSKLAKERVLGNPRRGVYNADPSTTPYKTSEAPEDESGASDDVATTSEEGGGHHHSTPWVSGDRPDF
ncbi:hypothetical protein [Nocardioides deserti]|uniref:BlaI/MecI/CopY family transcriptional regulator n=1 Tax=Nocardioides deserti TaxID=1588644 RepID=A0ABR6UAN2_9ACTN|nr:hypothetical protein [Nocardioides deserti]MBC2961330.1 hypothetical protein [Nocardioides deserti]GGO72429.1 hypothetical protein GCM10012276_15770 [Nocardioides deserti]